MAVSDYGVMVRCRVDNSGQQVEQNRGKSNFLSQFVCHTCTLLSLDDEKALKLTISTEVLNMMFLSLLL